MSLCLGVYHHMCQRVYVCMHSCVLSVYRNVHCMVVSASLQTLLLPDIEVSCYGYEGIDAVKSALRAGLAQSTEELPIKINLIAPPQYVMTTTTLDRTEGIAKLNTAIQVIRETIEESEGHFNIKMEVSSVLQALDFRVRVWYQTYIVMYMYMYVNELWVPMAVCYPMSLYQSLALFPGLLLCLCSSFVTIFSFSKRLSQSIEIRRRPGNKANQFVLI